MASEPYLGAIFIFAGNFAPQGYALCQGQLMSIAQNSALFSILGTTYGGDGQTTFALPDLRGRAPIGTGTGPALPNIDLGQKAGATSATILTANLPPHTHPLLVSNQNGTAIDPVGNVQAIVNDGAAPTPNPYAAFIGGNPTGAASAASIGPTGSGVPVNVESPYLGINYIIATQGLYPSRP